MPSRPDTTVKYLESTQTGAPVLSGTAGALIAVLDAVLINGFGLKSVDSVVISGGDATLTISTGHGAIVDAVIDIAGTVAPAALNGQHRVKSITTNTVTIHVPDLADATASGAITMKMPGAGWTKVFSKTDVAVYKSSNAGATGMLLRVDDTGAQTARWRGYEAMTDVDTGTGPFPTDVQLGGGQYIDKSNAGNSDFRNWSIVANDRAVYLGVDHINTTTLIRDFYWTFFGDIVSRRAADPYRFVAMGNTVASPGGRGRPHSPVAWFGSPYVAYRAVARPYNGIGTSAYVGLAGHHKAFNAHDDVFGEGYITPFPNPTDNALLLGEVSVIEFKNSVLRGKMPGCFCPAQTTIGAIADATVFEGVPEIPGRRILCKGVDARWSFGAAIGHIFFDVTGPWEA